MVAVYSPKAPGRKYLSTPILAPLSDTRGKYSWRVGVSTWYEYFIHGGKAVVGPGQIAGVRQSQEA